MADNKRYVCIWFRYLETDWYMLRHPEAREKPCVMAEPDHGRMMVVASNALAEKEGVRRGDVVADARAIVQGLEVVEGKPGRSQKLLKGLADWTLRYTPRVGIHFPDALVLDATGCAHLWGSEQDYLDDLLRRLMLAGYSVRIGMADTIGVAWAVAHQPGGNGVRIIVPGAHREALGQLSPALLRIEPAAADRLRKLGLRRIGDFMSMPRTALRRRFGQNFLTQLDYALGSEDEPLLPVHPVVEYQERLPALEPVPTATGITIALERLLDQLCSRLSAEGKGLRTAVFRCLRIDGRWMEISIGTNRPSSNRVHLHKLFSLKTERIEPGLGIELFILEAPRVEELVIRQEEMWRKKDGLAGEELSELIDRLAGKLGADHIRRYLPAEHYWPERSMAPAVSVIAEPVIGWRSDKPRPVRLLDHPELIEVTAPIPDYPPMLFRHKGRIHLVKKADGPERIEQEWWIGDGQHRDYYYVEDQDGRRYWIFRLGHYEEAGNIQWFLHGFFA